MLNSRWMIAVLVALVAVGAAQEPKVPFPVVGKITPRSAKQIASSSWSIGGETLDRDYAIYGNYSKYVGSLGAKAIRVQTGWAKIEKQKGVYDFAWLDDVVNDALAQGVQPWLETNYGNPLYSGGGETGLGGGIPSSPEALAAWDKWVRALVQRYKDRVRDWEVWNEPDLGGGGKKVPPDAYGDLFIRTARIIREERPDARIYALGLAGNTQYLEQFLQHLKQKEALAMVDVVTVHGYPRNPDDVGLVDRSRAIVAEYSPKIEIRQGETGAPSTAGTFGALSGHPWTELTQAKWNLRRLLAHHAKGVPMNLFTLMELHYAAAGGGVRVNTKGLLKSNPDKTVERPKPAYYAAQHVFSIFDDTLVRMADYPSTTTATRKLAVNAWARRDTKKQVVAVWFSGEVPSDSNELTAIDLTFEQGDFTEPVYVDLRTGAIHAIPPANWSREGGRCIFRQIPVYDSPILIAERSAVP